MAMYVVSTEGQGNFKFLVSVKKTGINLMMLVFTTLVAGLSGSILHASPVSRVSVSEDHIASVIQSRNDFIVLTENKVTRVEINTELGQLQVEFYSQYAEAAITELTKLIEDGYYNTDVILVSRPPLGFVITKSGQTRKSFKVKLDPNKVNSRRGSIAIPKLNAPSAYLNTIFFGFQSQPLLEKDYIIIGQVIKGLDLIERSSPGIRYKVNALKLVNENMVKAVPEGPVLEISSEVKSTLLQSHNKKLMASSRNQLNSRIAHPPKKH